MVVEAVLYEFTLELDLRSGTFLIWFMIDLCLPSSFLPSFFPSFLPSFLLVSDHRCLRVEQGHPGGAAHGEHPALLREGMDVWRPFARE